MGWSLVQILKLIFVKILIQISVMFSYKIPIYTPFCPNLAPPCPAYFCSRPAPSRPEKFSSCPAPPCPIDKRLPRASLNESSLNSLSKESNVSSDRSVGILSSVSSVFQSSLVCVCVCVCVRVFSLWCKPQHQNVNQTCFLINHSQCNWYTSIL